MKKILVTFYCAMFANFSIAGSIPEIFDNGVEGIKFFDKATTESVLTEPKYNCRFQDKHLAFCFQSADGAQQIMMSTHFGGVDNEIAEIEITLNDSKRELPIFPGAGNQFETEKNIHLGMTAEELKSILGEPHDITSESHYRYRIDNHPYFLEKYNSPIYYADYLFAKDELVQIRYGFRYVLMDEDDFGDLN